MGIRDHIRAGRYRHTPAILGGTAVLLLLASPATGETRTGIDLQQVVTGLSQPVHVTHAGDGSGRLFIVEQRGSIRVVRGGKLLPAPFL